MTYLLTFINLIVIGYFSIRYLMILFRYGKPRCKNVVLYINNKYCLKLNEETGKIEMKNFQNG